MYNIEIINYIIKIKYSPYIFFIIFFLNIKFVCLVYMFYISFKENKLCLIMSTK